MTKIYYFAYGSNLNQKQMLERCPDSKPVIRGTLPNYKLVFAGWSRQWMGGTATVKTVRGEKTLGAIYEISERDSRRLDGYEGYPNSRIRLKVMIFDEAGNPVEAFTYIKTGRVEETPPSKKYLSIVQQGYRDWKMV